MSLTEGGVICSLSNYIVLKFYFSKTLDLKQLFDNFLEEGGRRQ